MENQDRPNLFHYATSELSQDAFICWLAAWADPKYKGTNPALHQAGTDFVRSMLAKKPACDVATIKAVKVSRQVGKLDVLIELNKPDPKGEAPGDLAILIEDKTHTFDHGTQLTNYYGHIMSMGYTEDKMIPLYFKTGYQSRFDTLGIFKTYLRKDFLKVLRDGQKAGIDNAIFNDFLAHLENMEHVVNQYHLKDISPLEGPESWNENDWRGFFMELYEKRSQFYEVTESDGANWNYVANPSGGFFGFWWYFRPRQKETYTPYLQLEQEKLCFKIMVEDGSDRRNARDEAFGELRQIASQSNVEIQRPDRMGNGKFMTVARWKDDYRVFNNGVLNMPATLENLKKAQTVIDKAFETD